MTCASEPRKRPSRGGQARSRLAAAAGGLGGVCTLLALIGPLASAAAQAAGVWPRMQFHYLFLCVVLGPVVLVLGVAALHATRAATGKSGRGLAWLGCGTGVALTAALLAFAWAPH